MKKLPSSKINPFSLAVLLILGTALFNLASAVIFRLFNWPLFFDTWATSLAAMLAGPVVGGLGGTLYNLLMAIFVSGSSSWVWALCSVFTALVTYYLWKEGWVSLRAPLKLLGSGLFLGTAITALSIAVSYYAFGEMATFPRAQALHDAVLSLVVDPLASSAVFMLLVNVVDKTATLVVAASVFDLIPKKHKQLLTAGL